MENLRPPFIFISYRRQDSSSATRWLYSAIQKTFGGDSVFVDTESIRTGANWPQTIDNALGKATILITVTHITQPASTDTDEVVVEMTLPVIR